MAVPDAKEWRHQQTGDVVIGERLDEIAQDFELAGLDPDTFRVLRPTLKQMFYEQLARMPGALGLTGKQHVIVTAIVVLLAMVSGVLYGGYRLGKDAHDAANAQHERLIQALSDIHTEQVRQTEVLRALPGKARR